MKYLDLPFSPKPFPRLIIGAAEIGSVLPTFLIPRSKRNSTFNYLDQLQELGCTAFDTAAIYQWGGSERSLGEWMQKRKNRDQITIITKGLANDPLWGYRRFNPKALKKDLHDSLRRLKTRFIDIYLLHRDNPDLPFEPILEVLETSRREGKIGSFGVSNWTHQRIEAANTYARQAGFPPVLISSPHYSLFEWTKIPWPGCVSIAGDQAARAYYREKQIFIFAWSPLGRGMLSDRTSNASEINSQRKERAALLANAKGVSAAQIALAYLFNQPHVFPITSAHTIDKIKENIDAMSIPLSPEEILWLEKGGSLNFRGKGE